MFTPLGAKIKGLEYLSLLQKLKSNFPLVRNQMLNLQFSTLIPIFYFMIIVFFKYLSKNIFLKENAIFDKGIKSLSETQIL